MIKLILAFVIAISSIYSLGYTNIDGVDQGFASFQGKKILVVNIATGSEDVGQIAELQALYDQYSDSLVIVAFPTNDFQSEPRTNSEIKQFCQSNYGVTFRLGALGNVTGTNKMPIYQWLGDHNQNGVMSATVVGDFQKFLIDKNGALIGIYQPSIHPLDTLITHAIEESW